MKILYVGPLQEGGTCLQRGKSLENLGHDLSYIDTFDMQKDKSLIYRGLKKLKYFLDNTKANQQIIDNIKVDSFDLLWIDKGTSIKPKTLNIVKDISPAIIIVSYSPDDMMNPRNHSIQYHKSIPLYDLHVTTKSYNVAELKVLGTKDVMFVGNAYNPHVHRKIDLSKEDIVKYGGDVGFIGDYEEERANSIIYLVQNGINVRVWGNKKWVYLKNKYKNLTIEETPIYGDDYAKAINAFKINLGFLRKVNRDLQTTRSIEIPACGAFMLAERTREHLEMFEEGKEAEFFKNNEELLEKCKFYLKHDEERSKIAQNGYNRCLNSGYSNEDRILFILNSIRSKR